MIKAVDSQEARNLAILSNVWLNLYDLIGQARLHFALSAIESNKEEIARLEKEVEEWRTRKENVGCLSSYSRLSYTHHFLDI